jgi:hypothetical protein
MTEGRTSAKTGTAGKYATNDRKRTSLAYQLRYAIEHPHRIGPYASRRARNAWLRIVTRGDHVRFYREVVKRDAEVSPSAAIGSKTHDRWLVLGEMQFEYLVRHGLSPEHHLLEIGCGMLRAGWRFIDYLEPGHYYGLDISPDILLHAQKTISGYELQDKLPHLTLVQDLRFEFLPDEHFDAVHAHSVFSHSPIEIIDECLAHVARVMKPDAFFDFTFDRTIGVEHQVLNEAFFYRSETLISLAERHGLDARLMEDWEAGPHQQSKIRVTRRP